MAKEKEITAEKTTTIEGSEGSPSVTVEQDVSTAPITDETAEAGTTEMPEDKDLANVRQFLSEVDTLEGGDGEIGDIPPTMMRSLNKVLNYITMMRDLVEDPLYKDVMDDMAEQKSDGKVPSLLVAIARSVPMDQLQNLADMENYEDIQAGVQDRISLEKQEMEDEASLEASMEESLAALDAYAEDMGLPEERKLQLQNSAVAWFKALGDLKITRAEWEKLDKAENYDADMEQVRSQLPSEPVKEVMPDRGSMETVAAPAQQPTPDPTSMIGAMSATMPTSPTDFTQVGKRKFQGKR